MVSAAEAAGLTFWDSANAAPRRDYRNADTVEVPTDGVAEALWKRVEHAVPRLLRIGEDTDPARSQPDLDGEWEACGTNTKLLIARYLSGGHFAPHTDGYSVVDFNHRSMYTMLLYLNTVENGGGTRFYHDEQVSQERPTVCARFASDLGWTLALIVARAASHRPLSAAS